MSAGRRLRLSLVATGSVLLLLAGAAWLAGSILLHPQGRSVIPSPGRELEEVRFEASDGVPLRGWWWPGRDPGRAVLLLHGLGADRLQMFPRAKWLHESGYSVFLFDFRGCGGSGGRITFGFRERLDVEAALGFLTRAKKVSQTVVLGQSMGAAAALLAVDDWGGGMKGAILELPFTRFGDAVRSRVREHVGWLEPVLSPLLLVQIQPRLGFRPEELAPLDAIARARCPILLGFGGRDPYAREEDLAEFFRAAPYPATLWVLQKAGHTDLFRYDPQAYEAKVGGFIASTLGSPDQGCKG